VTTRFWCGITVIASAAPAATGSSAAVRSRQPPDANSSTAVPASASSQTAWAALTRPGTVA
jgi:hypothetical protein